MNKIRTILFASLLCTAAAVPLFSQQKNDTLTVIFSDTNYNLNPHTSAFSGEAQILNSLYEGLFSYDPATLEPVCAIAQSYKTSRDGKHWTFTLRSGLKFSDGRPLTATDVKNSWLNLLATKDAPYASFLDVIKGAKDYRLRKGSAENVAINVKDDLCLTLELTTAQSHLPKILCHHAFAVTDTVKGTEFSGPYRLVSQKESRIILCKNAEYYKAQEVQIPNIKIILSNDEKNNAWLLNTGKAQWSAAVTDSEAVLDTGSIHLMPLFGTYYFFFKLKNPYLTAQIRNALLTAFPWQELRAGSLFPAGTLVLPLPNYIQPAPLEYTDFDLARSLLKEQLNAMGISEDKLKLTFAIPEGQSVLNAANILKNNWAQIGIELEIKIIPDRLYLTSVSSLDADLFIYTWIGDFCDPLAFLELFRSDSTLNETRWADSDFDSLLDKASCTSDLLQRYNFLSQAEEILLSSGIVMPVSHSIDINYIDLNTVGGWSDNALNIHPFKNMYFNEPRSSVKNIVKR